MEMQFEKLSPLARLPIRQYPSDAGLDICACITGENNRPLTWSIPPRSARTIPTGLRICPPDGHAVFVLSRSGLAVAGVFVANAPGLIDPGYRGELKVILYNGSAETFYVKSGDRIAQLVPMPVVYCDVVEAKIEKPSDRGVAGFGSTGV